jgi:hypothetical protein
MNFISVAKSFYIAKIDNANLLAFVRNLILLHYNIIYAKMRQ